MVGNKVRGFLNVTCLTCLLIDSGGGLGIRNLSFLIIFLGALISIYKKPSINKTFILLYFLFLISLIPGIIVSYSNGIPIASILVWIVSFLLLPLLYYYIRGNKIDNKDFVVSGGIFATLIIILFFGRLFNIGTVNVINDYIVAHSDGFFGDKSFLSGDILPNVYFQGTLALVICGIISLENNKIIPYILILIALILAPSRFGFLVLSIWGGFIYVRKSYVRIALLPLIVITLLIILSNLAFGQELFGIFNGKSDGLEIRNGHITSIYESFKQNYLSFFFGEGPGSFFYSKGVGAYVDNIEISQIEFLRKYGIFSFIVFTIFYFWPVFGKRSHMLYIKGGLFMFYVLSSSNPVLYSIFSMFFLAFAYVNIYSEEVLKINTHESQ